MVFQLFKNQKLNYSLVGLIGLLIGTLLSTSFAFADNQIKLIVNGREIQCDVSPQELNGRTMVPARFLAEALGATVTWDETNNAVVVNSKSGQSNNVQPKSDSQVIKPSELPPTPTQADILKREIDNLKSSGVDAVEFKGMPAIVVDGQTWFSGYFYGQKFSKPGAPYTPGYGFNNDTKELTYLTLDGKKIVITNSDDSLRVFQGHSYINSKYYREP